MKKLLIMLSILVMVGCASNNKSVIKNVDDSGRNKERYNEIIQGFNQDKIEENVNDSDIVEEYRVIVDRAFAGYYYYDLKVYVNGKGKFTYMVHQSRDFKAGEIVLDETKKLSKDKIESFLNVINDNDFWNINQKEVFGLDGYTVFIEGYKDGTLKYIDMWGPEEDSQIYKIYKAFADFGDTIAENPLIHDD